MLLKKLTLKNFKSFKELVFDLSKKNSNKLICIYGENGSGKSNIISVFTFLKQSFNTLVSDKYNFLHPLISSYKMINSDEVMELIYEFSLHESIVLYRMVFNNTNIIEEELKFKKTIFKINKNFYINPDLKCYIDDEVKDLLISLFGKHSFMSILYKTIFIKKLKLEHDFVKVIDELFYGFSIYCDENYHINNCILMNNITEGILKKDELNKIRFTEEALRDFFISLFPDIKNVFYKLKKNNNYVQYLLYFKKNIDGIVIEIPYYIESRGTLKLLHLFPFLVLAKKGKLVFIDGIDEGIHDILIDFIFTKLKKSIEGQLIITTHNLTLLKILIPKEVYIIKSNHNGKKDIISLDTFPDKFKENLYNNFIDGYYGGIPIVSNFDFDTS